LAAESCPAICRVGGGHRKRFSWPYDFWATHEVRMVMTVSLVDLRYLSSETEMPSAGSASIVLLVGLDGSSSSSN